MGGVVSSDPNYLMRPSSQPFPHASVPTGSGQVFVPPPEPPPRKGSGGILIAVVAVLGVIAAVAIVVFVVLPQKNNNTAGTSGGAATQPIANTTPTPRPTPTPVTPPPPDTKVADNPGPPPTNQTGPGPILQVDECQKAINQAHQGHVIIAVKHYKDGCQDTKNPRQQQAKAAIDAAGLKAAQNGGCSNFDKAKAANSIGAKSGFQLLKPKHCGQQRL
jgi:hypothetical protein